LRGTCAQIKVRNRKGAAMQVLSTTEVVLFHALLCGGLRLHRAGIWEGQVLGVQRDGALCVRGNILQAAGFVTSCTTCWHIIAGQDTQVSWLLGVWVVQ
jgi:hypothetical protein